jgi:siroheme synthase
MGVEELPRICNILINSGMKIGTKVAIVENGTTKKQRELVGNLGNIVRRARRAQVKPPAVIIIGKVVSLHKRLAWFSRS